MIISVEYVKNDFIQALPESDKVEIGFFFWNLEKFSKIVPNNYYQKKSDEILRELFILYVKSRKRSVAECLEGSEDFKNKYLELEKIIEEFGFINKKRKSEISKKLDDYDFQMECEDIINCIPNTREETKINFIDYLRDFVSSNHCSFEDPISRGRYLSCSRFEDEMINLLEKHYIIGILEMWCIALANNCLEEEKFDKKKFQEIQGLKEVLFQFCYSLSYFGGKSDDETEQSERIEIKD